MEELLTEFLAHGTGQRGYSYHTIKGYRSELRAFFSWLASEGVTEPAGITRVHVECYDVLQAQIGKRPQSRRRQIAAIRAFIGWAVEHGRMDTNPTHKIKLPKQDDPDRTAPTAAEKDALLDGCRRLKTDERCALGAAILSVMFFAGLRPSEAVALDVTDIDLIRRRLVVKRGKGGKRREMPINDTLAAYLSAWMLLRPTTAETSRLFVSVHDRPMSYPILRLLFVEIKVAAGLRGSDHLTAHCLRHWFATQLHAQKTDVAVIQKLLGHKNLNTTQTYIHCLQNELDAAVRSLDVSHGTKPVRAGVRRVIRR